MQPAPEVKNDMPLVLVLDRHWENHSSKLVARDAELSAIRYWTEFFGTRAISEINVAAVRQFIEWLREKGASDSYCDRILSVGRAAINAARRDDFISATPFIPNATPKRQRGQRKEPKGRPLEMREVAAIFDSIEEPHHWRFCMLALTTLARPGAIFDLRPAQYFQTYGLLALNPEGRMQNSKFRATLPVSRWAKPLLDEGLKRPEENYVNIDGKPVMSIRTWFRNMRTQLKLGDKVNPMSFRTTSARAMRAARVRPDEISVFMGHAPAEGSPTTETYAEYDPAYCNEALIALDLYIDRVAALSVKKLACPPDPRDLAKERAKAQAKAAKAKTRQARKTKTRPPSS